jgi:hypothetical protein
MMINAASGKEFRGGIRIIASTKEDWKRYPPSPLGRPRWTAGFPGTLLKTPGMSRQNPMSENDSHLKKIFTDSLTELTC